MIIYLTLLLNIKSSLGMAYFAQARYDLTKVLESNYDEFKIIWSVFVPDCDIRQKNVHAFLDMLTVYAKHYFTFIKILMIYHDKFHMSDQALANMYGEAVIKLGLQEFPMFNYESMKDRHAKEVQTVNDVF